MGISRFAFAKTQVIAEMRREIGDLQSEYRDITDQKLNSRNQSEITSLTRLQTENVRKRSRLTTELSRETNRLQDLRNDYAINRCDFFLGQFPGR